MANRGVADQWTFKDAHLDPNIAAGDANKFVSAARCILYAAPADKISAGQSAFQRIGVVQGYSWGEQKQLEMIFELGSDIPYFIPGRTTGQISISRILLSGQDLLNLVYKSEMDGKDPDPKNWIRSLRDVNIPLDLMFCFYGEGATKGVYDNVYTRLFKNCWMQSRNESISAGQILVAENVSIMYEYVSDYVFQNKG
ncbi:MAG: hypothetical protein N2749_00725 [Clostridia bacterium]|nr:hypothetical protein [Clostridia bacterium]